MHRTVGLASPLLILALLEVRFTASALVLPRGADRLTLLREPSGTATAGVKLERQPRVQIRDPDGSDLSRAGVRVTAAIVAGNGNLSGTSTQLTDGSGRAEFTDLKVDGGSGDHVLIFAADGYASVTSGLIDVRAAANNGGGDDGRDKDDKKGRGVARIRAARARAIRAAETAAEPVPVIHLLSGRLARR